MTRRLLIAALISAEITIGCYVAIVITLAYHGRVLAEPDLGAAHRIIWNLIWRLAQ